MSYVAVSKETGIGIFEFYNPLLTEKINKDKYTVLPILTYLEQLNKSIREKENNGCNVLAYLGQQKDQ